MQSQLVFFLFLPFFLIQWISSPDSYGKNFPLARKDISKILEPIFCGQSFSPEHLWKYDIFDGQIEAFTVEDLHTRPIDEQDLWDRAKSIATVRHAGGYVAGLCPSNRGFIATMPAPTPLLIKNGKLLLPLSKLNSECQSWTIDYTAFAGGRSTPMEQGELQKKWSSLRPGMISVSCQPPSPRWLGPKIWYFIPIKKEELLKNPTPEFDSSLSLSQRQNHGQDDLQNQLVTWIQKIRQKENLPPFQLDKATSAAASLLSTNLTIDHDRSLLNKIKQNFENPTMSFVGENRVQGSNLKHIVWMLWNSPKHRDLLLEHPKNQKTPLIGIEITTVSSEYLVTIVVAQRHAPDVAKNSKFKDNMKR
jgi:hypothetical protein